MLTEDEQHRVIPAWAGNTNRDYIVAVGVLGHPRVGGHWGADGFEPCDGCGGTGRAVAVPREAAVQAYPDRNERAPE